MNAVIEAREPSARYLAALEPPLLRQFDLIASAPNGVARLRELILTLAVQGKLVAQDQNDEPASLLLERIRAKKVRLLKEGKIRKDKPPAEIAEEEKPYAQPSGWEWVRLNQLLVKIGAGSTPLGGREVYVSAGVKFLRSQNVWNDGLRLTDVAYIKPETHLKMSGTTVYAGDILFNITGASIGRCAVVPATFDEANVSQHVTIIRPALSTITSYLHLVLISSHVQQTVMDVQVGVSREGLSIGKLGQFLVPVPPVAEQSRIVARVEELMALCDLLETKGKLEAEQHVRLVGSLFESLANSESAHVLAENWQRIATHFDLLLDRPAAVDALEQTILHLAVRGLLVPQDPSDEPASVLLQKIRAEKDRLIATGQLKRDKPLPPISDEEAPFKLPEGWEWASFGNVSINRDGERIPVSSADRERRDKIYDYYGASGVIDKIDGYLFDSTLLLIGEDGANLINRSTPIAFLAHGKYWVNNHAHVIDTTDPGLMDYLCLFINAISLEPYVTGTAQPKMNQAKLNSIFVALPPLAEQSRIVVRVAELSALCAQLRDKLAVTAQTQSRLAETLIEKAVA